MAKFVTTPNIRWTIENFGSTHKKLSPIIRFMGLKFHLRFSQYLESNATKLQLNMEQLNVSPKTSSFQLDVDVGILFSGYPYLQKSGKYNLTHNQWCVWTDFVSTIHKNVGQINDITFIVMIRHTADLVKIFSTKEFADETKQVSPCVVQLSEDIGLLFNNAKHSDFTLQCSDKSFFVHKAVLSSRSEFFEGMFWSNMKETNENFGRIEEIEPDILEIVLRYLYTGEIPQLPLDSVRKVYVAADRFILKALKKKCYSLWMDNFMNQLNENPGKQTKSKQGEINQQTQTDGKEQRDVKERQMLRDLFMTREWILFSEEFPDRAHAMCKPYFIQEL